MSEEDADLCISKSNIEVIGSTATKICVYLVRKYCLGGTLHHLASSAMMIPLGSCFTARVCNSEKGG